MSMSRSRQPWSRLLPAITVALLATAQTSTPDAHAALEEQAIRAYLSGSYLDAADKSDRAVQASLKQFGDADWRTAADLLRASFFAGHAARPDLAQDYLQRFGGALSRLAGAENAIKSLTEDYARFSASVAAPGKGIQIDGPVSSSPSQTAGLLPKNRRALVIGNSKYRADCESGRTDAALARTLNCLRNPVNDAARITTALKGAGFEVTSLTDATLDETRRRINAFVDHLEAGSVVLFYYSGHGVQIDGENYILPVDFGEIPDDEERAKSRAYNIQAFYQDLVNSKRQPNMTFLFVDACRTRLGKQPSWFRFPVAMIPGQNGLIAYATQFESEATDAGPGVGVYAEALAKAIETQDLEIRDALKRVKGDVMAQTKGRTPQTPYFDENLVQNFYFHPPRVKFSAKSGLDYAFIPKGSFTMGCTPSELDCTPERKPHEVRLTMDFWMGQTEVTVRSYEAYLARLARDTGIARHMPPSISSVNDGWLQKEHPMVTVSWEQAAAFCKDVGGRLPTEAEWEYAARGRRQREAYGQTAPVTQFDFKRTKPVTDSLKNDFQLYGMAENVDEWTADTYDPNYYKASPATDPPGPPSGAEKVIRGASWSDPHSPISLRKHMSAGVPSTSSTGFRCVLPSDALDYEGKR
jgi:formylglycine-generating enzyme required for sulfatase activity